MLKLKVQRLLKLEDPVENFIPQSTGWYIVQVKNKPLKNRYNLGVKKLGFNYKVFVHDFKESKTHSLLLNKKPDLELVKTEKPKKTAVEHKEVIELYETGKKQDNGYLKRKKLTGFNKELFNIRLIDYKFPKKTTAMKNLLLIPYTTFELYPTYVAGKLVAKDGSKYSIPKSKFKAAFHAHRYNKHILSYIIGEGYPECCIAANLFGNFNVLEAGPVSNVKNLLLNLTKNKKNVIYVMGEHGSEDMYEPLREAFPTVRVSYPPDKDTKDFGDYFIKAGLNKTKDAILGILLEQKALGYKPLGTENEQPVFYSKVVNSIIKIKFERVDTVYRLATNEPENAHTVDLKIKKALLSKIFMECAQSSTYTPDKILPVGLWPYKSQYFYNDGTKVLEVKKEDLQILHYSDVIKSDFLLHKVANSLPIEPQMHYNHAKELTDLISLCDWENDLYAKILLGFLIQSFYSGSIIFRPHLWIESETTHAGKSWLSSWCGKHLVLNSFKRESGRSTSSGTAQAMANLAGLLVCDEFAESGSIYKAETIRMIELLRSASTATNPIVLGTPEQKPILGHIKFSALLSCIEGQEYLKRQDFDRIVFIKFGAKKGSFESTAMPKFRKFIEDGKHFGFASHALKGFYMYQPLYDKLLIYLTKRYPKIGHKARGLASIIAGYAILYRTDKVIKPLLEDIHKSSLIKPFMQDVKEEDIIEKILRTVIIEKYIYVGDNTYRTILELLEAEVSNTIISLGLRLKKTTLKIYACEFRNFNDRYLKLPIHFLYKCLKSSKYFVNKSNSYFNGKKTLYYEFNLKNYIVEKRSAEETLNAKT